MANEKGHWYTDKKGHHYFVENGQTPKEGWEASKRRKMIKDGKFQISEDGEKWEDTTRENYANFEADGMDFDEFDDLDIDEYDEEDDIINQMKSLRKQEEDKGKELTKKWSVDKTISDEEYEKQSNELHEGIQSKLNELNNKLKGMDNDEYEGSQMNEFSGPDENSPSYAQQQALDMLKVSNSKYNDPEKVQVMKSPKGNWILYYDGKNTGEVVGGDKIDEEDARTSGMILETPEEENFNDAQLNNENDEEDFDDEEETPESIVNKAISMYEKDKNAFGGVNPLKAMKNTKRINKELGFKDNPNIDKAISLLEKEYDDEVDEGSDYSTSAGYLNTKQVLNERLDDFFKELNEADKAQPGIKKAFVEIIKKLRKGN